MRLLFGLAEDYCLNFEGDVAARPAAHGGLFSMPWRMLPFPIAAGMRGKRNDVDSQAWLADVLARLPDYPARRIADVLPWNWKRERPAQAAA
jgi:IS66 C-terminal element